MKKLSALFLLFLLLEIQQSHARIGQDTCISDSDINVQTTSTTIIINWVNICNEEDINKYKIHFNHESYIACNDGRKDIKKPSGFGIIETDKSEVVIENLHPFSNYKLELKLLKKTLPGEPRQRPELHQLSATTKFSIPKATAQHSTVDYSYRNTDTKLMFNWSPPLKNTECDKFYSHLGEYVYKLQGIDPWNRLDVKEDVVPLTQTNVEIPNLMPYSNYIFFLYITNNATKPEFDVDVYLKLEGRTLASKPDPPELKTVESISDKTVHLEWMPAYPPRGELSHYEVRWTRDEWKRTRTTWLDSHQVQPGDALCSEDHPAPGTACFTVNNLEPGNYTFQITTFNKDVTEHSEWSTEFHVELTFDGHSPSGQGGGGNRIIIIGSCVILFFVILAASIFFYRRHKNKRNKGFEIVNKHEPLPPIFRRGQSSFSDTSNYTLGSRSAQDPLPPAPPAENIYSELKSGPEQKLLLPGLRTDLDLDDDHYLKPNPSPSAGGVQQARSTDSLDEEGYLKPNFNRFQRMNTSSPENELVPSIPAVSYFTGNGGTGGKPMEPVVASFVPGKPSQV